MQAAASEFDVTGTIRLEDPEAVADAVVEVLRRGYGDLGQGERFLRQASIDLKALFWGRHPGHLHCDTPYHDLRHSLDTGLLLARMVDGWRLGGEVPLSTDQAVVTVFLGLYHDVGFIRRVGEGHLAGPALVRVHEQRGVEFARQYLAGGPYAAFADWSELILATCFALSLDGIVDRRAPQAVAAARLIGSADLIAQVSDRAYLERCRDFLYHEMAVGGCDRMTLPDGRVQVLYESGLQLLEKTPAFYRSSILQRLGELFGGVDRVLQFHFGGDNPYRSAMDRNLDYLGRLISGNQLDAGLRRAPVPLMPRA